MGFLYGQLFTFFVAISYGIFIGILFDLYRSIKIQRKISKYLNNLLDILFWLLMTFIFIFVLLSSNWGEVRGYVFMGIGLGVLIHYCFISSFIIEGLNKIIFIIKKTFQLLFKYLFMVIGLLALPFIFVLKILKGPINLLFELILKFLSLPKNLMKKLNKIK